MLVVVGLLAIPAHAAPTPQTAVARVKPVSTAMERCEIVEYGLYRPGTTPVRFPDPLSVTGERFETDEVEFTRQTKSIPMELGKGFGIRYRLRGLSRTREIDVRWRVSYPKPGIRGAASWEHGLRERSTDGTLVHHLLYDFHYAWEMVPGAWTFEVTVDGAPACSLVFHVR